MWSSRILTCLIFLPYVAAFPTKITFDIMGMAIGAAFAILFLVLILILACLGPKWKKIVAPKQAKCEAKKQAESQADDSEAYEHEEVPRSTSKHHKRFVPDDLEP